MAKVLIIEDDVLLSKMYTSIFQKSYEVATASNGQEGLEQARADRPDVVLLDIMMPKLNGMQFLERMKSDPELKDIPVIVLTNLAGDNDVQTAMGLGAARYIIKSEHRPKEVESIVSEVLASAAPKN